RASARIGETGYNLIHNNCEHFVNECALGVKYCSVEDDARKRWNSRPILDVYLARTDKNEQIEPVYPPERQKEIAECKNEKLKLSKYADWCLLKEALGNSFHLDFNSLNFSKTKNGKWLTDGVFFSLSHSGNLVAVAVSNMPVGIDIEIENDFSSRWENKDDKFSSLVKKVYTKKELKNADNISSRDFLKVWTLKEAIFKRNGKGNYRPDKIDSDDKNSAAFILEGDMPLLSLAGIHLQRTRFYISENGKLSPIKGSKL
ncbi:MAG: 4'-phosphopantetheinyl transferase superfamily protein, partial [Clostridia bacterium]|nr:4'-phosphopantetheinyl transferase superfamily protein [Clostridia bacterium]